MVEDNLQALFVILAHIVDFLLIEIDSLISLEMSNEVLELSLDISDDFLLLKPDEEWASDILKVKDIISLL